jgi:hypothetical protein
METKMNKFYFAVLALALGISGCAKDKNSAVDTSGKDAARARTKAIQKAKYAGAVVYEFGKTTASFDTKNLRPVSQIIICIDRTETARNGNFEVQFSDLGVEPYRLVSEYLDTHKTSEIWDLKSLKIDYSIKGKIDVANDVAYGTVDFKSTAENLNWEQVYTSTGGTTPAELSRENPFEIEIGTNTIQSERYAYYHHGSQTYYIKIELERFGVIGNELKQAQAVEDCETSGEAIIFKTGLDQKK